MAEHSPGPRAEMSPPFTALGEELEARRAGDPDPVLVEMVAAVAQAYERDGMPSDKARAAAVDRLNERPRPETVDTMAAELGLDADWLRRIAGLS